MDARACTTVAVAAAAGLLVLALAWVWTTERAASGRAASAASARRASIVDVEEVAACPKRRTTIRIIHHGDAGDVFWQDVERGFRDAARVFDVDLDVKADSLHIPHNVYGAVNAADGILVTIPFLEGSKEYRDVHEAIEFLIDTGMPVVTFNTDTYHNRRVFEYVGSFNKLLGVRGARLSLERWPGMDALRVVVAALPERFNVTLDWRADNFHAELEKALGRPLEMRKTYDVDETREVVDGRDDASVLLMCSGIRAILTHRRLLEEQRPGLRAVQVGDTGRDVSEICVPRKIPFVGQQQYQQGYNAVSAMVNILRNYARGSTWEREKGNSASSIDSSYECVDDCKTSRELVRATGAHKETHESWMQVGVALVCDVCDIAAWDEYCGDGEGREHLVYLSGGGVETVAVTETAERFDASSDPKRSTKAYYDGLLNDTFRYWPLYERTIDRQSERYQYFVVTDNATRVPVSKVNGLPRLLDGMFVRIEELMVTFRVLLYDEDDLTSLQKVLTGTLGNRCSRC